MLQVSDPEPKHNTPAGIILLNKQVVMMILIHKHGYAGGFIFPGRIEIKAGCYPAVEMLLPPSQKSRGGCFIQCNSASFQGQKSGSFGK
jgi:hypothetical protein